MAVIDTGSFFNVGDGRANAVKVFCEIAGNVTGSVSFDPSSMKCFLCKESTSHRELARLGGRGAANRMVFALADQGFPAALPAAGAGDCVKIIRVESGTLNDLKNLFLSVVSGFWIPPGSIVLVGSLTELVTTGLAGYLNELVNLCEAFKKKFGSVLQVVPFVPMLMGGLNCAFGLRSVAKLAAWLGGGECLLPTFTKSVWEFLSSGGRGELQPIYESRISLPMDISGSSQGIFHCMGWPFLRSSSIAINECEEKKQITALITDLNRELALTLDVNPSLDRTPTATASSVGRGKRAKFVVMGASHAKRIAKKLIELGYEVIDFTDGGWKLSNSGIAHLVEKCEQLKKEKPSELQLVLSVLDSALFWGESDEGSAPARKLGDNRFHLEGRVKLASREVVTDRFSMISPLLLANCKLKTVLLSPIPRFVTGGCCNDTSHCSNWKEESFVFDQLQSLERTRQQLRDCVLRSKVKSVMVMNPVKLFGGGRDLGETAEALKAVWGNDPVHPEPEVYQRIVEEMVVELDMASGVNISRGRKRVRIQSGSEDGRMGEGSGSRNADKRHAQHVEQQRFRPDNRGRSWSKDGPNRRGSYQGATRGLQFSRVARGANGYRGSHRGARGGHSWYR